MPKKIKFELNRSGVRELLRSEQMKNICKEHVENAKNKLGNGYEVTTHIGKNRVNASIRAESSEARKDNLKNNTILKAVNGG
jgi:hypothetical protein